MASSLKGSCVLSLDVSFLSPWVLTLVVSLLFISLLRLSHVISIRKSPEMHPLPSEVDSRNLDQGLFAHFLRLNFQLLRLRHAHPEHEEDQAPYYSLECLH